MFYYYGDCVTNDRPGTRSVKFSQQFIIFQSFLFLFSGISFGKVLGASGQNGQHAVNLVVEVQAPERGTVSTIAGKYYIQVLKEWVDFKG